MIHYHLRCCQNDSEILDVCGDMMLLIVAEVWGICILTLELSIIGFFIQRKFGFYFNLIFTSEQVWGAASMCLNFIMLVLQAETLQDFIL